MDTGSEAGMTEVLMADNDAFVKIAPLLAHKKMDRSSGKPVLLIIIAYFTGG